METVLAATVDQRFAELRGKFIKWGGRILFTRSTGKAALTRLAKEEKALVKRGRGSATLPEEIVALRQRHAESFRPKLADIKMRFLQGARERFSFWFEKQMNVRPNEKMRRLPDTAEGSTKLKDLNGLITGKPDLEVANSVVLFAQTLTGDLASSDRHRYLRNPQLGSIFSRFVSGSGQGFSPRAVRRRRHGRRVLDDRPGRCHVRRKVARLVQRLRCGAASQSIDRHAESDFPVGARSLALRPPHTPGL